MLHAYAFNINGKEHHVQLEEHADGPKFVVDGESFTPAVVRTGPGSYTVTIDGIDHVFQLDDGRVQQGPNVLDVEVRRAKPVLTRVGGKSRKGSGQIKPPMPGKIVEINVAVGDEVAEGDPLLVLEAMKMQNDLKSPIAGTIKDIKVKPGENVEATTIMIVVEPAPSE